MLEVSGLSVSHGRARAVTDATLSVREGQLVCLIGANGAGKTTVLRTLMGLHKADAGSAEFHGQPILGIPSHRIVDLGICMVPEARQLFAEMTVRENLEVAYARHVTMRFDRAGFRRKFDEIVTHFPRIAERQNQLAGTLSGGEQQMVAIARSIMGKPRLLLLDEPSLGLAPLMIDTMFDIIHNLHRAGLSMLLVEQNAEFALEVSDFAYVMERGNTALSGPSLELMHDERVRTMYFGI